MLRGEYGDGYHSAGAAVSEQYGNFMSRKSEISRKEGTTTQKNSITLKERCKSLQENLEDL